MGIELLFLLLPVAAYSGWLLARRVPSGGRKGSVAECNDFSEDYFKGLNYLLNEQPDKAIEIFIHMLEVNSETVETHFALANLFRRRGEVERAIRIHQNLIARPTLNKLQRSQALFELANDYLRAGLYDRAEALFQELVDEENYGVAALENLLNIYEQEKDWSQAIESAQRLKRRGHAGINRVIAHYYCELAEEAEQRGEYGIVSRMIKNALGEDKQCTRAHLLEAGYAMRRNDYKLALKSLKRIDKTEPVFFSEAIPLLVDTYEKLGRPQEIIGELDKAEGEISNDMLYLLKASLIHKQAGIKEAEAYLSNYLGKHSSLKGMLHLLTMRIYSSEKSGEFQDILDMISNYLEKSPGYRCGNCGFTAKRIHWQCPSCKKWDSVKPIQSDEIQTTVNTIQ